MLNDGASLPRILGRRELVTWLGASAALLLFNDGLGLRRPASAQSDAMCIARPEQTEGPYFVDEGLLRSDIRTDPSNGEVKAGVPLALTFRVSEFHSPECRPLSGAQVDVWHCDAMGIYSDVQDPSFTTVGRKFLRGYQVTDDRGEARFLTIYPGWYEGRTVHIHFKIRTQPLSGHGLVFTSQLYFDDAFTDRIYRRMPYAARGRRRTNNHDDRIFRRGGERLLMAPMVAGEGYAGDFAVALQMS